MEKSHLAQIDALLKRHEKEYQDLAIELTRNRAYQAAAHVQDLLGELARRRAVLEILSGDKEPQNRRTGRGAEGRAHISFRVSGTTLYKRARARHTGKPYEHGVPHDAYIKTTKELSRIGDEFNMSELISRASLPTYQPYVVVLLLEQ